MPVILNTLLMPNHPPGVVVPHVAGLADFAAITRFLDQEIQFTSLFPSTTKEGMPPFEPAKLAGTDILLGIPVVEDVTSGQSRAVSRMIVAEWPVKNQVFPCLITARFEKIWNVIPFIYDDLQAAGVPSFLFQERWVRVLFDLAKEEISPLLHYATDFTNVTNVKIGVEAQTRCNYFRRKSADAFFSTKDAYLRWMIASSWPEWEDAALSVSERINDLVALDPPIKITISAFLKICNALQLPKPKAAKRSPKTTKEAASAAQSESLDEVANDKGEPILTVKDRELELLRDWSPEADAVFSYGGPPELIYDRNPAIYSKFPAQASSVDGLASSLWWWRSAFYNLLVTIPAGVQQGKWPDELMYLFRDNWERSAFLYEFRARYKGRYQWDLFGRPWVKLNNSERGVLACMWPVKDTGRYQITPQLHPFVVSQMTNKIRLHVVVDASTRDSEVADLVLAKLNEERKKRGVPRPGRGKKPPRPQPWSTLELLDVRNFGLGVLNDAQRGSLSHATRVYKKACMEFGIDP